MTPTSARYDVVVIGGGPAGSTAAILLARAGWNVALVEHARFPRRKVCGEFVSASTWPLLRRLGVNDQMTIAAGRPVTHVGLFAGKVSVTAPIARECTGRGARSLENANRARTESGRAISRAELDSTLLDAARTAGAHVYQPWTLLKSSAGEAHVACTIAHRESGERRLLDAGIVIDAHGAWEPIALPGERSRRHDSSDLLGFKAHFDDAHLAPGLMPLLSFSGGYGGMVASGHGRTSLSLCIRRDQLADCRLRRPGMSAGDAVLDHIRASCAGVDAALTGAALSDRWIAAGPLATGIRGFGRGRVFAVGNAAAEAHPVIAEGISMAIQSSALLVERLLRLDSAAQTSRVVHRSTAALDAIRSDYAAAWRSHFALRLNAASLFAHLFMRPLPAAIAARAVAAMPMLLTLGASFSGKTARTPSIALGAEGAH